MHSILQHILSMFLCNIKHVLNQERDIIIHVILKKNKTDTIKYFCLFENFQCFWIFFLKTKQPKTKIKTCPQIIERIISRTNKQHSP